MRTTRNTDFFFYLNQQSNEGYGTQISWWFVKWQSARHVEIMVVLHWLYDVRPDKSTWHKISGKMTYDQRGLVLSTQQEVWAGCNWKCYIRKKSSLLLCLLTHFCVKWSPFPIKLVFHFVMKSEISVRLRHRRRGSYWFFNSRANALLRISGGRSAYFTEWCSHGACVRETIASSHVSFHTDWLLITRCNLSRHSDNQWEVDILQSPTQF